MNLKTTNMLAIFQIRFPFCTTTIISRVVLKCFLGGSPSSIQTGSISNIKSQNAGNNRNNKGNADISDIETCLSLESERNKEKLDCWSDQKIQDLRKMRRASKVLKSSKHHNIWVQMKEKFKYSTFNFPIFSIFPYLGFI